MNVPMGSGDVAGCCGHDVAEHEEDGCGCGWKYGPGPQGPLSVVAEGCRCIMRGPATTIDR